MPIPHRPHDQTLRSRLTHTKNTVHHRLWSTLIIKDQHSRKKAFQLWRPSCKRTPPGHRAQLSQMKHSVEPLMKCVHSYNRLQLMFCVRKMNFSIFYVIKILFEYSFYCDSVDKLCARTTDGAWFVRLMGLITNGPLYSRLPLSSQENASQLRWSVARDDEYIYFLLQYI